MTSACSTPASASWTIASGKTHNTQDSWTEEGRTYYRMARQPDEDWYPNQCLRLAGDNGMEALVRGSMKTTSCMEVARDYRRSQHGVWGIQARNPEQNFALNLLMDPEIDFVTLLGTAGTGKTLLALAAGLAQTLDDKIYREIVMTRATVSVGEDIGLPARHRGRKDDALDGRADRQPRGPDRIRRPRWRMGPGGDQRPARLAHQDSLAQLHARAHFPQPLPDHRRGPEHHAQADEDPDHPPAGPGTKIVCLGNVEQIDTPLPDRNHLTA
jgi:PhoH-like ATPase